MQNLVSNFDIFTNWANKLNNLINNESRYLNQKLPDHKTLKRKLELLLKKEEKNNELNAV